MKKCWICRRTAKEIIEECDKLGYEPIALTESEEEREKIALVQIKLDNGIVYICPICDWVIKESSIGSLLSELEISDTEEIVTKQALKDLEWKIKEESI